MKLDTLALVAFAVIGAIMAIVYGGLLIFGMVQTFPYGLPVLVLVGVFVFICVGVVMQRLNNKEDDYYEKNVDK